jgi:hypothetical protein
MFIRLGLQLDKRELRRIARIYLELIHAISLAVVEQKGIQASRTTSDLNCMAYALLAKYLPD